MSSAKSIKIGLIGTGTVGFGVFSVLQRNQDEINRRLGTGIEVAAACARNVERAKERLGGDVMIYSDPLEVVRDPNVQIVVELIGGITDAKVVIEDSIKRQKPVVTANKALIAEAGNDLIKQAIENETVISYEAAVAGGIPIIKALREGLTANRIDVIAGIVNGTTNFILSEMRSRGVSFDAALKEAQELGYAEADPTFDVDGTDAAQKLAIMSSIAFGIPIQPGRIFYEGITKLQKVDIEAADEFGFSVKLLAIAKRRENGIEMRVHPTLVPKSNVISSVNGAMNAVLVDGNAVGQTLHYGAGAGAGPTASAVIADIIDVVRRSGVKEVSRFVGLVSERNHPEVYSVLDMGDISSSYYIRLTVSDEPGVLSDIASILADQSISIESMRQREPSGTNENVDIIILTHTTLESAMDRALKKISKLRTIHRDPVRLRIELF